MIIHKTILGNNGEVEEISIDSKTNKKHGLCTKYKNNLKVGEYTFNYGVLEKSTEYLETTIVDSIYNRGVVSEIKSYNRIGYPQTTKGGIFMHNSYIDGKVKSIVTYVDGLVSSEIIYDTNNTFSERKYVKGELTSILNNVKGITYITEYNANRNIHNKMIFDKGNKMVFNYRTDKKFILSDREKFSLKIDGSNMHLIVDGNTFIYNGNHNTQPLFNPSEYSFHNDKLNLSCIMSYYEDKINIDLTYIYDDKTYHVINYEDSYKIKISRGDEIFEFKMYESILNKKGFAMWLKKINFTKESERMERIINDCIDRYNHYSNMDMSIEMNKRLRIIEQEILNDPNFKI